MAKEEHLKILKQGVEAWNAYQMVKDVRTEVETGNVTAVLDGDIDAFIQAYLKRRR